MKLSAMISPEVSWLLDVIAFVLIFGGIIGQMINSPTADRQEETLTEELMAGVKDLGHKVSVRGDFLVPFKNDCAITYS
jgi:hypothetical protein